MQRASALKHETLVRDLHYAPIEPLQNLSLNSV